MYLPKDRPPVPPTKFDVYRYFFPNKSISIDIEGNVSFPIPLDPNSNDTEVKYEQVELPSEEELDTILQLMLEEWGIEEKRIDLRNHLKGITEKEWWLWKDIHDDIIPGKNGKFYQNIKSTIDKYSEGKETILYPYSED